MKRFSVLSFLFLLLWGACRSDSSPSTTSYDKVVPVTPVDSFRVVLDSLIKRGGGPCKGDMDCMTIRVVWPVLHGGNPAIRKSLNALIYKEVIANLEYDPEALSTTIEQAADSLIDLYRLAYDELETNGVGYSMDVVGNMTFRDSLAILTLDNYYYTGGAHGNYGTGYYNYNLHTGVLIKYDDFIRDTTAFKSIAKAALAKHIETAYQGTGLSMDQLFWGGDFFLPANFKLAKDSLEMVYNPYEAAPYAVGQITFKLPYNSIRKVSLMQ